MDDNDQEERKVVDIDFHELYYKYSMDQNEEMRVVAASCLHEGFLLALPHENIKKLQMTLLELLEEENKDILLALIPNTRTLIERFCNDHAMNQLSDHAQGNNGDSTPTKGYPLAHSTTVGNKLLGNDFSSLHRKYEQGGKGQGYGNTGAGFKKLPSMQFVAAQQNEPAQDEMSGGGDYIISPEYKSEIIYQELLPKILILDEHIHNNIGLWRQHADFLDQFSQTFNLFHMPELHDMFLQTLFKYLQGGNNQLRSKVCKCIVNIIAH